jgi:hypothetical protein
MSAITVAKEMLRGVNALNVRTVGAM